MGDYKEHKIFNTLRRKGIITTYIVIILIVLIVSITLLGKTATGQKEIHTIVYEEDSKINYKVYLKENEFFEEEYLEEDNQYIASLINYIESNFYYELSSPEKGVDYKYSYKVEADVEVLDKTSKKPIYEKKEVLVEEKTYSANTNKKLMLNQPIKVDYNKYNDLIKSFVNIYELDDITSTLTINMYVNLIEEGAKGPSGSRSPVMTLKIPLTEKTMGIELESKAVNANSVTMDTTMDTRGYLFVAILLVFADLIIVRKLVRFIKDTENEQAVYNAKLRKIMVSYGSYIQKLNNEFDFDEYQILEIDIFEDLLQIRETVNKPILMVEQELAQDTYFFIPTEKNIYVYELKKGNLINNKGKRYKENKDNNEVKI